MLRIKVSSIARWLIEFAAISRRRLKEIGQAVVRRSLNGLILRWALRSRNPRFLARLYGLISHSPPPPPYDGDLDYPSPPAQPRKRSALFLHHTYYQFHYLAKALRARGWDAVSATLLSPDHPSQIYMLGEDKSLYDSDPKRMHEKIRAFYLESASRFGMVHFGGNDWMSFFPQNFRPGLPWDFIELKHRGVKIGYSISGCHDGVLPQKFNEISGGLCDKCAWQVHSEPCWERDHAGWSRQLELMCDLIAVETDWPTPPRNGPRYFHDPLTSCLDPTEWSPGLVVPERLRIARQPGEILLMHSFGNVEMRQKGDRDIKGSRVVQQVVDRLVAEGWPIRFLFATNVSNNDMRYLQLQADIVVDQLNYGRYGATTRQAMMLGRPVLTSLLPNRPAHVPPLQSLAECPVLPTSEETLYDDLKRLLARPETWAELGARGRDYAMRWHSAEACAERFERVYDAIHAGQPPASVAPLAATSKNRVAT